MEPDRDKVDPDQRAADLARQRLDEAIAQAQEPEPASRRQGPRVAQLPVPGGCRFVDPVTGAYCGLPLASSTSTFCVDHYVPTGGRRSAYRRAVSSTPLAAAFERQLANDDYKDLREELALARSFVEVALQQLGGVDPADLTPSMLTAVQYGLDQVRSMVDVLTRVDQKLSVNLTITDVHVVVQELFVVITRHVTDPKVLKRIAADVERLALPSATGDVSVATMLEVPAREPVASVPVAPRGDAVPGAQ